MEFRLVYEGPLLAQGAKAAHKWEIRRALHPQLARLWQERPLAAAAPRLLYASAQRTPESILVDKDGLRFAPLVSQKPNLYAEISVLLMRQQTHGALFNEGGDIDNRPKTLLDALIRKVSVETAQLLRPAPPDHVLAIIGVHVEKTMLTYANMAL